MRRIVVHEGEPATVHVLVFFVDVIRPPLLFEMRGHAVELFGVFEKSIFIEPRDVFELEEADLCQHFDELRDQLRLRLVHVNSGQFDEVLLSKRKLVLYRILRHGR